MSRVAALWRHPIKAHGREPLTSVTLTEGQTLPWDRRWAVTHELTQTDGTAWAACANFTRAAKVPGLMAITTHSHEDGKTLTLSHPDLGDLTFNPDDEAAAFLAWIRPLMPENRAQSTGIIRARTQGLTDSDYPSVSLINLASVDAMTDAMQQEISAHRFRGNIHLADLPAWQEFDWVGKSLRIGTAELAVREPIERCRATTANPDTGQRDADTLGTLNTRFGHQNFGVNAVITQGGTIAPGDAVTVL